MRFIKPLTNFSAGQLSKNLFGRIDVQEYESGLSYTSNCLLNPQGGAYKRIGSKLGPAPVIGGSPATTVDTAHIESFVLENGQTVIFEWIGAFLYIKDFELNDIPYTAEVGALPFETDTRGWNGAVYGSRVFLTHYSGNHIPIIFDFADMSNVTAFLYQYYQFRAVPFLDRNSTGGRKIRVQSGNNIPETGPYILQTDGAFFTPNMVGHQIYIAGLATCYGDDPVGGDVAYNRLASNTFYITGYISPTQVTSTLSHVNFPSGTGLVNLDGPELKAKSGASNWFDEFAISAWGNHTGHPKTVSVYEGRLIFGGTRTKPSTIYASELSNPYRFMDNRYLAADANYTILDKSGWDTVVDVQLSGNGPYTTKDPISVTDPYQFTMSAKNGAPITFIEQSRFGAIGTYTNQFLMDGDGSVISQLNIAFRQFSSKSSYPLLSVSVDNTVFYADATRTKVYMYMYNDTNGSYISKEVTLLYGGFSEDNYIISMKFAREFQSVIIVTSKGNAVALAYNQETRTLGFTNFFTASDTTRMVDYVPVTTDDYGNAGVALFDCAGKYRYAWFRNDSVYGLLPFELFNKIPVFNHMDKFVLNATLNSDTVTDMEVFGTETIQFFAVDSLGNLDEFEITHDGSASITFAKTYVSIAYGLNYVFEIATMPIEAGQAYATAQTGMKRVDQALVRTDLCETIECGSDGYNYDVVPIDNGKAIFEVIGSTEIDHIIYIRHSDSGPCMINNIALRGVNNDG